MAIYHFHFSSVQRSKGMCSIPYAAYIRGASMTDERTGTSYNFSNKEDIAYSNILIPENSPTWLKELVELKLPESLSEIQKLTLVRDHQNLVSEKLWNMSELKSLKCNARTANIVDLALPKELTLEQNIELLEEFVKETYTDKGMLVDIAIHEDEQNKNPHGHLILLNREINENGFGMVNEYWNTNAFLKEQRKDWADKVNEYLEIHGIEAKIDHRSYKEQGIELEPTVHLGVGKYHEGKDRYYQNQEIKQINALRILENPGIAFDALVKAKTAFTRDDLADITLRYSENDKQFHELMVAMGESKDLLEVGKVNGKTTYTARSMLLVNEEIVEAKATASREAILNQHALARFVVLSGENALKETLEQYEKIAKDVIGNIATHNGLFNDLDIGKRLSQYNLSTEDYLNVAAKIKGSGEVILLGTWIDGQDTYTTRALFNIDCEIQELTERLCNSQHLKISNAVREKLLEEYQQSLPEDEKLKPEQYVAVGHILRKDQAIDCIVGRAGTGKSYSLKAAQHIYEKLGVSCYGVAFQGVAADRLSQGGINARTIDSFKDGLKNNTIKLKKGDVLFVDEAGMTSSIYTRDVLKIACDHKLKIVPVGDPNQIDPVGSGAPFKWLLSRVGYKELTTVARQKIEWQARATEKLSVFNLKEGLGAYDLKGYIKYGKPRDVTMNELVADLLNHRENEGHSISQYITLAHANIEVDQLNAAIRAERVNRGEIAEGYSVNVEVKRVGKKTIQIAQDDRVLFLENKPKLGVSNGSFGTVASVEFTEAGKVLHFVACLDGEEGRLVQINPSEYNKFDLGYAATVHKSQAMTQDFVYAFDDKSGWVRNLVYVAASRHKWMFKLFTTQKDFNNLVDSMSRVSLKDSSLGFPWMFAQMRGFATEALNPQFKNQLLNKLVNAKETVVERFEYYFRPEAYEQRQTERQEKLEAEIANSRATNKGKIVERENARLVASYAEVNRKLGKAWEEVRTKMAEFGISEFRYGSKEFNLVAATSEYQALERITAVRDQLAAEISKNVSKYTKALEVYNLRESKLADQAEKHQKRILVDAYVKEVAEGRVVQRDQLAEQICRNVKGHFIFLKAKQVDMQALYQQSRAHERRAFMMTLSPSELKGFRLVEEYKALNRELAIKMKTLPNSRGEITGEIGRYQEANISHLQGLVDKRNHVAYAIYEHIEACDRSLEYFGIGSRNTKEVANWLTTQHVQGNAALRMLAILDAEKSQEVKNNFEIDEKGAQQRWYRLQQHSAQVVVAERVRAYQEAVVINDIEARMQFAHEIGSEAKFHHGVIVRGDRPADEVWKEIRKDAKTYEFEQKLTGLSLDQQAAYRVVKDYIEARAECGKAWGEAFVAKAMAGDMEEKAFFASVTPIVRPLEVKRNALADKILANPEHHLDAMLDLKIDLQEVLKQSDKHNRAILVKQYQETAPVLEKAKLAQKLCEDPEGFRKEVAVASIKWRDIRKVAGVAERIEVFKEATTLEKKLIRDIDVYKDLNRQVGKTWSEILAVKETKKEANPIKQAKADLLLAKRDSHAAKISEQIAILRIHQSLEGEVSSPKVSQHIFEGSKLDFAKVQKQAEHHQARVEIVKEWEALWPRISKSLAGISTARTVGELSRYEQDIFAPAMADMKELMAKMKNSKQYTIAFREVGINFAEFEGKQARLANMGQGFKELKEELSATPNPYKLSKDDHKSIRRAQQIVRESLPAEGTIVECYLREERGIVGPLPTSCRYHPEMYLAGKKVPAAIFVGQTVDKLGPTVVQAIHLDPVTNKKVDWVDYIDEKTGKAHKVPAKLTYGRFLPGSSILINEGKDPSKVGIVEGPETGLSIADANPDLRVELVLGTSNLKKIRLANTVKEAIIFADYDGVGAESEKLVQKAGEFYARKGVDVLKVIPEGRSGGKEDFNDVARKEGIEAVKAYSAAPKLIAKARTVKEIAREITEYAKGLTGDKVKEQLQKQTKQAQQQSRADLVLREKAEHHLAAIEKDTAVFNASLDGKEKYQKARNVYILITKVLRDPILNDYLKEYMPGDYSKVSRRHETIKEQKWDKLFQEDAAKAAEHYAKDTLKKADEFNKTQDGPERYKKAKDVYTNIRLAYRDPLIKEHLEEHMPTEHAKLQERLSKIAEHGLDKRFEEETAKAADKAIKARFNAAKAHLEAEGPSEKREELGNLYKVIQRAYNDPLLKMHLQDKAPQEYEKFEQNLQVIKKQGLHVEFEHEMQKKTTFSKDMSL